MNESKAARSDTNTEDVNVLPSSTQPQPAVANNDDDMPPLESTSSTELPTSSTNEPSNETAESKQRPTADDDDDDIHEKVALGLLFARLANDTMSMLSTQGLKRIAPKFLKLLLTHNSVCEKSIEKKDDIIPIGGSMTSNEECWRDIEAFLEARSWVRDPNDKVGIFFFDNYMTIMEKRLATEPIARNVKQIWSAYSLGLQYRVTSLIMKELK